MHLSSLPRNLEIGNTSPFMLKILDQELA